MARGCLVLVLVVAASGCYRSHLREVDVGPRADAGRRGDVGPRADAIAPDAPPELCLPACTGAAAVAPIFHASFDGSLVATGPSGVTGAGTGPSRFVSGVFDRALRLPLPSRVTFPATAAMLASADELTFSIWVRLDRSGLGRAFLSCRSFDRGFESYRGVSSGILVTCAGDGAGPPRAWGACESVAEARGTEPWTHFVVRWRGPGTEPEVASGCGSSATVHATMDFPVGTLDLFDGATDLETGVGAGDGGLARGWIEVDDLRVYDVALPDETLWETTACPTP